MKDVWYLYYRPYIKELCINLLGMKITNILSFFNTGLKQGFALSPLLFNWAVEYATGIK